MDSVLFEGKNGLGDKLLDFIGAYVICDFFNYKCNLKLNSEKIVFPWGHNSYDERLFTFDTNCIELNNPNSKFYIESINPSASLCPYNVYKFLATNNRALTFEEVCNSYKKFAVQLIQPSEIILNKIPKDISNAYGIHLRKTDKINNTGQMAHENTQSDFDIITQRIFDMINDIKNNDDSPRFLIVSEDKEWKKEIEEKIALICGDVSIIKINYEVEGEYDNFESVIDMFCLSKCKQIIQGVKYSTFSILASLIGNVRLVNFSEILDSRDYCLIHNWSAVLNTNITLDVNRIILVGSYANKIKTNILDDGQNR